MSEWEEWEMPTAAREIHSGGGGSGGRLVFPSLKNLYIHSCPKLLTLSPVLRHLPNNLKQLTVYDCPKLAFFSAMLRHLTALEHLDIRGCDELVLDGEVPAEEETISSAQQPVVVVVVDSQSQVHQEEHGTNDDVERQVVEEGQSPYLNESPTMKKNYGGAQFRSWMEEHHRLLPSTLVRLVLDGCCKRERLPTLGWLPSLRNLTIAKADRVKKIGPEFYGETDVVGGGRVYFPHLEYLCLKEMSVWEEWEMPATAGEIHTSGGGGGRHVFPSLKQLWIDKCPKLASLSPFMRHLTNLEGVDIRRCDELTSLDGCECMFPSRLKWLCIEECPKLASLSPILRHSSNLERIKITRCAELVLSTLEEGDDEREWMLPQLTALKELHIRGFPNLRCLPPSIHNLRSLRYLRIKDCHAIECLPDGGLPPSLEILWIERCPLLEGRCREGGSDHPKIPTATKVIIIPEANFTTGDDDARHSL